MSANRIVKTNGQLASPPKQLDHLAYDFSVYERDARFHMVIFDRRRSQQKHAQSEEFQPAGRINALREVFDWLTNAIVHHEEKPPTPKSEL